MVVRARAEPIRGEKIVGYITRGKGVSALGVCPNVMNLLYDLNAASRSHGTPPRMRRAISFA